MPLQFTAQQRRVVQMVRDTAEHLLIRATAGSGKTTTLTEAAWHLPTPSSALYFVYNKHAAQGVEQRLPPGMQARTLHAYGLGLLARTGRSSELKDDKTADLLDGLGCFEGILARPIDRALRLMLARAWDLYREMQLCASNSDDLALLLTLAGWPPPLPLAPLSPRPPDWRFCVGP
ncbi:UvrD-helicase domain-containing protein [Deinococcus multiflagellatus]|uniref:UvrD-helicase domain-containing protein n=2 Tax=Deinococcus multiflagellatus TaxID=1656887 RepID=A0ABW1ZQ56_9DEIO